MKRIALLVPLAMSGVLLAGCGGTETEAPPAARSEAPRSTTSVRAMPAVVIVPGDLVGKTMGEAKALLAKAGFTNVVVAGGDVTDADKVESVPEANLKLAPTARVRLIGAAPEVTETPDAPGEGDSGCGPSAVDAGRFDPSCPEYQGYLDPGTAAGRGPTSGEVQQAWGCEQGYIPESEC